METKDPKTVFIEWLSKTFKAGDKLPSASCISDITGYTREAVFTRLHHLSGAGCLQITHGKPINVKRDPLEYEEHF